MSDINNFFDIPKGEHQHQQQPQGGEKGRWTYTKGSLEWEKGDPTSMRNKNLAKSLKLLYGELQTLTPSTATTKVTEYQRQQLKDRIKAQVTNYDKHRAIYRFFAKLFGGTFKSTKTWQTKINEILNKIPTTPPASTIEPESSPSHSPPDKQHPPSDSVPPPQQSESEIGRSQPHEQQQPEQGLQSVVAKESEDSSPKPARSIPPSQSLPKRRHSFSNLSSQPELASSASRLPRPHSIDGISSSSDTAYSKSSEEKSENAANQFAYSDPSPSSSSSSPGTTETDEWSDEEKASLLMRDQENDDGESLVFDTPRSDDADSTSKIATRSISEALPLETPQLKAYSSEIQPPQVTHEQIVTTLWAMKVLPPPAEASNDYRQIVNDYIDHTWTKAKTEGNLNEEEWKCLARACVLLQSTHPDSSTQTRNQEIFLSYFLTHHQHPHVQLSLEFYQLLQQTNEQETLQLMNTLSLLLVEGVWLRSNINNWNLNQLKEVNQILEIRPDLRSRQNKTVNSQAFQERVHRQSRQINTFKQLLSFLKAQQANPSPTPQQQVAITNLTSRIETEKQQLLETKKAINEITQTACLLYLDPQASSIDQAEKIIKQSSLSPDLKNITTPLFQHLLQAKAQLSPSLEITLEEEIDDFEDQEDDPSIPSTSSNRPSIVPGLNFAKLQSPPPQTPRTSRSPPLTPQTPSTPSSMRSTRHTPLILTPKTPKRPTRTPRLKSMATPRRLIFSTATKEADLHQTAKSLALEGEASLARQLSCRPELISLPLMGYLITEQMTLSPQGFEETFGSEFQDHGLSLLADKIYPYVIARNREFVEQTDQSHAMASLQNAAQARHIVQLLKKSIEESSSSDQTTVKMLLNFFVKLNEILGKGTVKAEQIPMLAIYLKALTSGVPQVLNASAGAGKTKMAELFTSGIVPMKQISNVIYVAPFAQEMQGWSPCTAEKLKQHLQDGRQQQQQKHLAVTTDVLQEVMNDPDFADDLKSSFFLLDEYDSRPYRKAGIHATLDQLKCPYRVNISATSNLQTLKRKIDDLEKKLAKAPEELHPQLEQKLQEIKNKTNVLESEIARELQRPMHFSPLTSDAPVIESAIEEATPGESVLLEFAHRQLLSTDRSTGLLQQITSKAEGKEPIAILFNAPADGSIPEDQQVKTKWAWTKPSADAEWQLIPLEDFAENDYKVVCLYTRDGAGGDFGNYSQAAAVKNHPQHIVLDEICTKQELYQLMRRLRRNPDDALPEVKLALSEQLYDQVAGNSIKDNFLGAVNRETQQVQEAEETLLMQAKIERSTKKALQMQMESYIESLIQGYETSALDYSSKKFNPKKNPLTQEKIERAFTVEGREGIQRLEQALKAKTKQQITELHIDEKTNLEETLQSLKETLQPESLTIASVWPLDDQAITVSLLLEKIKQMFFKKMDGNGLKKGMTELAQRIGSASGNNFITKWTAVLRELLPEKNISEETAKKLLEAMRTPLQEKISSNQGIPISEIEQLMATGRTTVDYEKILCATENSRYTPKSFLAANSRPQHIKQRRQGRIRDALGAVLVQPTPAPHHINVSACWKLPILQQRIANYQQMLNTGPRSYS